MFRPLMGHYQEVSITRSYQRYTVKYQKTNYGLINIKYNWGGHDPNTGRSAIEETQREAERDKILL